MKKGLIIGAGAIAALAAVAGIGYGASKVIDATCTSNSTGYDPELDEEIEDDGFEEEFVDEDADTYGEEVNIADAATDAGMDVTEF